MKRWLLFNAKPAIFQLYYGENKLYFNEMIWILLCTKPTRLSRIFIVLAHWSNSPQEDMSPHSNTLYWLQADQSLLLLLNAACIALKQQIPI